MANSLTMSSKTIPNALHIGIDVGSTTVKAVAMNNTGERVFADYRRHNADVRRELVKLLRDVLQDVGNTPALMAVTGSGGFAVAQAMGVPFVQEVIAETEATRVFHPDTDVIIELGGEDAKLTYLHPTPEQRMNGTCAGGTGAFIDQMATLLDTDASGLNELAAQAKTQYPIASRCGVFAKSDVQPLLNQGAAHADIAASVFTAVATQTIAGLACGRPIRGNVMLLGGPLHFLPELREAYRALLPKVESFITPPDAQLYVALGAALMATHTKPGQDPQTPRPLKDLIKDLVQAEVVAESTRMRPLFKDAAERQAFDTRHAQETIEQIPTSQAHGRCWLGIDAGSTTIKAVVIDERDRIVFTHYASNEGDPLRAAIEIVKQVRTQLPEDVVIGRCCSTGYGEGLVKTALTMDEGEVETMAHFRAANYMSPGVSSVIDIGGQDMKYIRIKDGVVDSISVNEACSAGCGSFLQTFAASMGVSVEEFANLATQSPAPVDLGTRCTVFMNSSVKQAQKEGADTGAIASGLSYSVVRNALYKVIKLKSPEDLGEKVVVQGGTFLNDAVLRAFELLTGRQVVRPNIAGLMGAYGAALTAKNHDDGTGVSSLVQLEDLKNFQVETTRKTCRLCQNHCNMTISTFSNGERHVSGNRCERGASLERIPKKSELPNLYEWKYKRMFGYRRLREKDAYRGDMGVPRVLGMYEDYPLWFTVLTKLGFRVMISGRSNHELFERGMESIPSENVCYPAKLAHGHIESLLDKGLKNIFYPCVNYNQKKDSHDANFNCPIVATYPEVLRHNMESLADGRANFISPYMNLDNREAMARQLVKALAPWDVELEEALAAIEAGFEEQEAVRCEIAQKGRETLEWMREHDTRGIVLAGRPYHLDPEINHGIPEVIVGLGMAVLTEDSVMDQRLARPIRVRDQWTYHSRLYEASATVSMSPDLQLVQLTSFGCGLDAVTAEQVQEILQQNGDIFTQLKIDEVSNLGAAKIRLRSLDAAAAERATSSQVLATYPAGKGREDGVPSPLVHTDYDPVEFSKRMRDENWEVLVPQMAPIQFRLAEVALRKAGYNVRLLEQTTPESNELGLKFVNNDACYPAIVVIGQLIDELESGRVDPNRVAVAISQTGGMCRATNYASLLRKGLRDAGYGQVPVLPVSLQSVEKASGFSLTPGIVHSVIQSIVMGDALQTMVLRTRPYEVEPGSVMALYERWNTLMRSWLASGRAGEFGRIRYSRLIAQCVSEFDNLPIAGPRKPRVGLVGEILVKFHPYANNHAVGTIEDEGCEAVLPGLLQFFQSAMSDGDWRAENMGETGGRRLKKLVLAALSLYERPVRKAFAKTNGKFEASTPIDQMAKRAADIAPQGLQAGEGWYLVGEMMDMIENGCPNIICAQPFACLPNHVVGKGMFRPLRKKYPQANIVGIDYDPGASAVNQLNRIKLMISTALMADGSLQWDEAAVEAQPATKPGAVPACGAACGCAPAGRAAGPVAIGMPSVRSAR
ncbi:acyl-CoA dehydratase activase-related protein [Gleimia hominis]|uniref:Acyl-CoA dehydratase activase-related protein n=1 Tax=Gleimia hominis TaxID=595468 RepID=A0ABU3IBW6_9ACTO|nr:acyl-CoA dehydratase activase-related protein [Gleimia hominis]MDT3767869.1 acyl-CoA dehydratase activase-related protein [Gleimia hominis]